MVDYKQTYVNFCFSQDIDVDWGQFDNFMLIWQQYEIAASYPNFRDFMSYIGVEVHDVSEWRKQYVKRM